MPQLKQSGIEGRLPNGMAVVAPGVGVAHCMAVVGVLGVTSGHCFDAQVMELKMLAHAATFRARRFAVRLALRFASVFSSMMQEPRR